jgi:hemerythrin-like domain-containing protein
MIQIGASAKPSGSEDPLQHLMACHRRIEQRLDTLERSADVLDTRPAAALDAIANSLTFFDTAGHLHTVDEEEIIFPLIRPRLTAEETKFLATLESEHLAAEAVYDQLKRTYSTMRNEVAPDLIDRFRRLTAELATLYRAHIANEDSNLMAILERVIRDDERSPLREEMRRRRQPPA